jgi:hypothetical protein
MKTTVYKYIGLLLLISAITLVTATDAPQLTDEQKELAINGIKAYDEVRDAGISQDGEKLSLALFVNYATNEAAAKDLGDSFVRMVKSFSSDTPPEKEIGPGIYSYLIGVYYPDQTQVALGAKCSSCRSITW